MVQSRHLDFPLLLNVRDLGGCLRRDGTLTRCGQLLRSDELGRLTPAGIAALARFGVRTILDLRWPEETTQRRSAFQREAHELREPHDSIRYLHVSMLGPSAEDWLARRPPVVKETWNIAVLELAREGLRDSLRAVAQAPQGTLLFHCHSGKDRTGILAALLLDLAEVQPEVIAEDYAITAERLRESYVAQSPNERETILESVRCPPENIFNMLAYLQRHYGGTDAYLHDIGLTYPEISALRSRLIPT